MGYDYALVHLYYTIPPAVALTALYRPLLTAIDVYKIVFLITIAVASTIPWDSFLIRNGVWSYPPDAIVGPTLLDIPAEELFFFVIQTYNTTLLYLIFSKPTFRAAYLRARSEDSLRKWQRLIAGALLSTIVVGVRLVYNGAKGFYMGLILVWAGPFILMLWMLAYQFLIGLPLSNTLLPIALPTLYLWLVDTLALRRGTWVIENGTKLGWQLWDGLEVEEAFFFFATNALIVFGLVAFDNALAILEAFPTLFPSAPSMPSPSLLIKALSVPTTAYPRERLEAFRDAIDRLRRKSRSFYLASSVFPGRLRHDLILLYSFCRVADDLVDAASNEQEAKKSIAFLKLFLDSRYKDKPDNKSLAKWEQAFANFPCTVQLALEHLPTSYMSSQPFYELLDGFEMDLAFANTFPIRDESTLVRYGERVAGTVAELIIQSAFHHYPTDITEDERQQVLRAGRVMGVALQIVNISRDIAVDAALGRVYIPTAWLKEAGVEPRDIIRNPDRLEVEALRKRLLDYAMDLYQTALPKIEKLPPEARKPMKVAVESYMEIGRVLQKPGYRVKAGRATVPKLRRIRVAWNVMCT